MYIENSKLKEKLEILLSTEERITSQYQEEKGLLTLKKGKNLDDAKLSENNILDLLGVSSQFVLMRTKNEDLHSLNKRCESKIAKLKRELEEKNHKVAFLDKLLIEKTN